jgi:class 3 adenylate cyclase/tetratricopeptide (TPR) repeat protein
MVQAAAMVVCSACGVENEGDARFCKSCGTAFAGSVAAREQRKTVTVVFCDVVGSTALGESQDPEAVRVLLVRYFERMRGIVEAHGGTVQKFIGDAVVAVFGVPAVHEDDAVRAVRAAVEMREALPQLQLGARIGVNTGEVVTSSDDTLVTGDAVNVAARLQQAASPGEVMIGEPTRALARDAISVEELAPLELKGKAEPVAAFRLVAVQADAPGVARRHLAPMVGREYELGLLRMAFEGALRRPECVLFTLLGAAGVGKSRLVREFLMGVGARVAEGRCLAYGEGITYRPVIEVVEPLGGADEQLLAASPGASETLGALLGRTGAPTTPEETAWAVRKLFEAAAQERPLVVVFDDIHWGEPAFLDLVEHVAEMSRQAPILLLCIARPELLDHRPGWGRGKLNATTVLLEPLDSAEAEELIGRLLGGVELEPGLDERIRLTAEGNPLFLEEMVAMLSDSGGGEVTVPPTIRALLAARLDQLAQSERSVLDRGSVEGLLFHSTAVEALARIPVPVEHELAALVRRELVRPDRPELPVGDAFRFRHILIRDAAYDALPKASRAELHERFADWLDQHSARLLDRDELLGYHLEQAYRYWAELGRVDADTRELGERAAAHLQAAGLRATDRGDVHAAASLLGRALEVGIAEPRERAHLQVELGEALTGTGRRVEADVVMAEAIEAATAAGERGLAACALAMRALRRHRYVDEGLASVGAAAEEAIQICSQLGDTRGLAVAWRLLAWTLNHQGRLLDTSYHEHALEFADASGDRRARRSAIVGLCGALCLLPIPAGEAIGRVEELLAGARDDRVLEARVKLHLAHLYAMAGRSEEALETILESSEVLDELNDYSDWIGWINWANARELAGDRIGAEKGMIKTLSYFQELDVAPTAKQVSVALAFSYCDDGRWEEAATLVAQGRELPLLENPLRAAVRLAAEARVAAHSGELDEAVATAERAVAVVDTAVYPNDRARIRLALAEVYRAAGRQADADAATAAALELYELKGNVAAAARVRASDSSL